MPGSVIIAYYVLLLAFGLYWWKKFRLQRASTPFNFHITDIWAAMLGLVPSMLIAANAMKDWEKGVVGAFAGLLILIVPAQILGLIVGRTHIEMPPHSGAQNAFQSGVSILTGALFGILIGAFAFAGAAAIYHFFASDVVWYIVFIAIITMGIWLNSRR